MKEDLLNWARDQWAKLAPHERDLVRVLTQTGENAQSLGKRMFKSLHTVNEQTSRAAKKIDSTGDARYKLVRVGTILQLAGEL